MSFLDMLDIEGNYSESFSMEFDWLQDIQPALIPQMQSDCGNCSECGRGYKSYNPLKPGCNPLLSLSSFNVSPSQNVFLNASCSSCELRDMFDRDLNTTTPDWVKGTTVVKTSDVLPLTSEVRSLTKEMTNSLQTEHIWNEIMIKKEKRSDYGSDSNISDINDISDELSDFLYSDEPGSSIFSDILKNEDSVDDDDKMIDVVSIDPHDALPGSSLRPSHVAEMHNYSSPAYLESYQTPLGYRNQRRDNRSRPKKSQTPQKTRRRDRSPSSSDLDDKVEEQCYVLSSTRVVRKSIPVGSYHKNQSHHRRDRRSSAFADVTPVRGVGRKRDNSEEREYVPEQKRKKEFDEEKREQHNVLERIRRCEMTQLVQKLRHHIPTLRDSKKHSKVVILDAAANFARNEARELERLLNRERQLDASIASLKRL